MSNAIEFGLGYDLTGLKTGGAQAQSLIQRQVGSMAKIAGTAGAGFARLAPLFGGAALAGGIRSVINFGSEITDLSESVGLSTDQFQQWSFALEQNGARQQDLVKTLGALTGKTQDALGGNEKAIASFEAMGVQMGDLRRKSPSEILLKMADALKTNNADGATTAAMMDLLGNKLTLKLVPALKGGSSTFIELGKEAKIASEQAIKSADDIGDAFDARMRQVKVAGMEAFVGIFDSVAGEAKKIADGFSTGIMEGLKRLVTANPLRDALWNKMGPDVPVPDLSKYHNFDDGKADSPAAAPAFTPPRAPWDTFKNFQTFRPPGSKARGLQGATMAGGISSSIFSVGREDLGYYSRALSGGGEGGLSDGATRLIRHGDARRKKTSDAEELAAAKKKADADAQKAAQDTAANTKTIIQVMRDVWD